MAFCSFCEAWTGWVVNEGQQTKSKFGSRVGGLVHALTD